MEQTRHVSPIIRLPTTDLTDWSKCGSKIVFASSRDGNSEIYVMDPVTEQTRHVSPIDPGSLTLISLLGKLTTFAAGFVINVTAGTIPA